MKSYFHAHLVNDLFGDPVVYIDFLFEKRALLFDLGEIEQLPPRKILRISHIFVSHTHMDHFIGFDRIVRLRLGRPGKLVLFGPKGTVEKVHHKLKGYTWNLVDRYEADFTIVATEMHGTEEGRRKQFRCKTGFQPEECSAPRINGGILLEEASFRVKTEEVDHAIPCLAFALEEKHHINVWKTRLDEMGLPTGPWLKELKAAFRRGDPDDMPFRVWWRDRDGEHERHFPLGLLKKEILHVVPGQKIAYVVDTACHDAVARRIVKLVRNANVLFIETAFLQEEADRAARTYHLTAAQAGGLARRAGVERLVPMHGSPRYSERAAELLSEAQKAFTAARASSPGQADGQEPPGGDQRPVKEPRRNTGGQRPGP